MSILSALKGTFSLKDAADPDVRLVSAPPPPPMSRVRMADVTAPPPPPKASLAATAAPRSTPPPPPPPVLDVEDKSPAQAPRPEPERPEDDPLSRHLESLGDEPPPAGHEQPASLRGFAEDAERAARGDAAAAGAEIDARTKQVADHPDAEPGDRTEVLGSGTGAKQKMEEAVRALHAKNRETIEQHEAGERYRQAQEERTEQAEGAMAEHFGAKPVEPGPGEVVTESGGESAEPEKRPVEEAMPEEPDRSDEAVEAMNEGGDEAPAEAPPGLSERSRSVAEILQEEFTDQERTDLEALRGKADRTPDQERRLNELRDRLDVLVFGPRTEASVPPAPGGAGTEREGSAFEENEELSRRIDEAREAYERAHDPSRPLASAAERATLISLLREKMGEVARTRAAAAGAGNEISRLAAEGRVAELKAELAELERPPGWMDSFQRRVRESYDERQRENGGWTGPIGTTGRAAKEKAGATGGRIAKARGFLWERIKGIGGFYEALQWEKLRRGTKEVAAEIQEREGSLWTEQMLQEQADRMAAERGYEKMGPDERKQLLREIESSFLKPMRERNEKRINEIVGVAMENYKAKLAKVRRAMTGESAVSPENLARVEARIRERLTGKARDLMGRQVTDYRRELRRLADPKWHWRLGFAGIQAVLAGLGIGHIGGKLIEGGMAAVPGTGESAGLGGSQGSAVEGVAGSAPSGAEAVSVPAGMEGAVQEQFVYMHENVWTTVRMVAEQYGGVSLPDSQLMEITKQVLLDNGMYEPEWLMEQVGLNARALPMDVNLNLTNLPAHMKQALGILQ